MDYEKMYNEKCKEIEDVREKYESLADRLEDLFGDINQYIEALQSKIMSQAESLEEDFGLDILD